MSQNAASRVTQIDYLRSILRDAPGTRQMFTDAELETYLWQTAKFTRTMAIQARKLDPPRALWSFIYIARQLGDLWRITVDSPVSTQDDYQINEPGAVIFQSSGSDTSDPLLLHGTVVDVNQAAMDALMAAASSPAKVAIYTQSNGLVMDTRQAADAMRTQAMHMMGVH